MQNALFKERPSVASSFHQTLQIMRLFAFFMLVTALHVSAKSISQTTVTFSGKNVPVTKIFDAVKKQTGYVVFYNDDILENTRTVTVKLSKAPLEEFLKIVLKDQPLDFIIKDRTIFISKKVQQKSIRTLRDAPPVTGQVTNDKGDPLFGMTINIKGTSRGTSTDENGNFKIEASENDVIRISGIGYLSTEITVGKNSHILVKLAQSVTGLGEIVVIVYGTQNKLNLTGAVASLSGKQ
jgi:hypothetical protein